MKELQKSISEWAEATFGPVGSNISVATRANKEMSELLQSLTADDRNPHAAEEVADVVMVLFRLADRMGFDLENKVREKLAINLKRQWKLDGHGHGYHVKEDSMPQRSSIAAMLDPANWKEGR